MDISWVTQKYSYVNDSNGGGGVKGEYRIVVVVFVMMEVATDLKIHAKHDDDAHFQAMVAPWQPHLGAPSN